MGSQHPQTPGINRSEYRGVCVHYRRKESSRWLVSSAVAGCDRSPPAGRKCSWPWVREKHYLASFLQSQAVPQVHPDCGRMTEKCSLSAFYLYSQPAWVPVVWKRGRKSWRQRLVRRPFSKDCLGLCSEDLCVGHVRLLSFPVDKNHSATGPPSSEWLPLSNSTLHSFLIVAILPMSSKSCSSNV